MVNKSLIAAGFTEQGSDLQRLLLEPELMLTALARQTKLSERRQNEPIKLTGG